MLAQRPDIQEKALKEIKEFNSDNQPLCDPLDDQKIAYIAALVRECLRYYTVVSLVLPRASVKDITYNGILIPKGTVVLDPTSLVAMPYRYRARFVPRNGAILRKAVEEFVSVE